MRIDQFLLEHFKAYVENIDIARAFIACGRVDINYMTASEPWLLVQPGQLVTLFYAQHKYAMTEVV